VINCLLFWALPDSWTQFDLLAPDVGERIEREMRLRFEGVGIDEAELASVIAAQVERIREFAADGVVLLATRAQGGAEAGDPPPGLSLTLALANRPTSGFGGGESSANETAPAERLTAAGRAAFVSEAQPFLLEDPELEAFSREKRSEVSVSGLERPLRQFQAQAFVLPKGQTGMAVITVTTFDPDREDVARQTARLFAGTLRFVTPEDEQDSPDSTASGEK
jgi:hypothetical protein